MARNKVVFGGEKKQKQKQKKHLNKSDDATATWRREKVIKERAKKNEKWGKKWQKAEKGGRGVISCENIHKTHPRVRRWGHKKCKKLFLRISYKRKELINSVQQKLFRWS